MVRGRWLERVRALVRRDPWWLPLLKIVLIAIAVLLGSRWAWNDWEWQQSATFAVLMFVILYVQWAHRRHRRLRLGDPQVARAGGAGVGVRRHRSAPVAPKSRRSGRESAP